MNIKFPVIITAKDYHAFKDYVDVFNQLGITKVKFHELDNRIIETPYEGTYHAIFYVGRIPNKDAISKLIAPYMIK